MGWEGLGRSLEIVGLERPRGSWTGLMPRKPNQWFLGMVFLVLIPNRLSLIMNALNMLTSGPTLVALFNEGNSSAFLVKMPSGLSGLLLTRPFWQLRNLKSKFHCSCSTAIVYQYCCTPPRWNNFHTPIYTIYERFCRYFEIPLKSIF